MQIPSHWAEATLHHAQDGRKITIRRYGWSDTSEADAQHLADERAREALARAAAGEDVVRREARRGYNGAEGTPIREEIVDQRGDSVLTRNSYGAVCLNTPDVLFVDIDDAAFEPPVVGNAGVWVAGILLALAAGIFVNLSYAPHGWLLAGLILMGTALIGLRQGRRGEALGAQRRETALARVRGQIEQFLAARPDWLLRLYRTPAGLRLMAVHRTFTPDEAEAQACFAAFEADPIYTRMCQSQRCFRARVSPKPWRMNYRRGLPTALAHWPVPAASRQARERWIQDYTDKAKAFASCHFLEEFGGGIGHPRALAVQDWHDELCRAHDARLPLA